MAIFNMCECRLIGEGESGILAKHLWMVIWRRIMGVGSGVRPRARIRNLTLEYLIRPYKDSSMTQRPPLCTDGYLN